MGILSAWILSRRGGGGFSWAMAAATPLFRERLGGNCLSVVVSSAQNGREKSRRGVHQQSNTLWEVTACTLSPGHLGKCDNAHSPFCHCVHARCPPVGSPWLWLCCPRAAHGLNLCLTPSSLLHGAACSLLTARRGQGAGFQGGMEADF